MKEHHYLATIRWTGNLGTGTSAYRAYSRDHLISSSGKPDVPGSSDPAFRGDKSRYSPEDSLLGALSACHMLWYLHLCADNKIIAEEYLDEARGTLLENADGSGQFTEVTLHPRVVITDAAMQEKAAALDSDAHRWCFVARSVNFPVHHQPEIVIKKK